MGLEGDPLFPVAWSKGDRPKATVVDSRKDGDDWTVSLRHADGTVREHNALTLAPTQVWEFSDAAFRNVMARERAQHVAVADEPARYRNADAFGEVQRLEKMLESERMRNTEFQNTLISSMNEMANDICRIGDAPFCKVFKKEYENMLARSERGVYGADSLSDSD